MLSAEPGVWRTDRVPYAREWMDGASLRHVRRITIMASTQVAKTETLNNVAGYFIHHDPSPIMLVMPSRETARLAVERRIMPMVRASEALRSELSERMHDTKAREIAFRRCIMYFRSAQSPTDLSSVPVRVVLCDEVDKYPRWSGREASPVALVTERTRTYYDHLIVLASTPTIRAGLIHQEYEKGDQRKFWVPCVHCGAWQVFEWKRVRWDREIGGAPDMRRKREAWYECSGCGGAIDDRHKRTMVERGVWVPAARTVEEWLAGAREADRSEHRSYHVWSAYSPWVQWWRIAAEFMEARHDPARMMNFVNSWLAEMWEEQVETTSESSVVACVDQTRASWQVPREVQVLTAAVDVQKQSLHWAIVGWGMDEEHWLVAEGAVSTWDELADVLFRNLYGEGELPVRCCLVDSRYRREEVMEFCRRWQPARMIAGVERDTPLPFSTVKVDRHPRTGAPLPSSMTVWTINVGIFKDLLAHRVATTAAGNAQAGRLHLPNDLTTARLRELSSEHKVLERSGSKVRMQWVLKPGHHRNELLDLMVYNTAAAKMIRVDVLRSPDRRREQQPGRSQQQRQQQQQQRPKPKKTGKPSYPLLPGE